ncbi:anti-sigma factor [Candidatus Uhrbacteria bacterium]|nr:anti-sigma factor [Candidatus Uhrbacteria bacterium]
MKKMLGITLIGLVLIGGGCFAKKTEETSQTGSVEIDRNAILFEARENGLILSDDEIETMSRLEPVGVQGAQNLTDVATFLKADMKNWTSAALADVTGGESYGLAHATFKNGTYTLVVDLGNLTEPSEGHSYQGWLVKRGEGMAVVNAGTAVKTETGYALVFTSWQDLSDDDFFVLTLETTDGPSTPEEHILEGSFR